MYRVYKEEKSNALEVAGRNLKDCTIEAQVGKMDESAEGDDMFVARSNAHRIEMAQEEDAVVISGISCRLPESDNAEELWKNLMSGVDMVTEDDRRWTPGLHGLPPRNGKVKDLSGFDSQFFGISPKQADSMDPGLRLFMETSYEAFIDAGINPDEMRGSKTGVFVGQLYNDGFDLMSQKVEELTGYEALGGCRCMMANRLSFFFDLQGPSMNIDTACSAGMECLCNAVSAIKDGRCDAAIVGGISILLNPHSSVTMNKLSLLSPDGACKAFDESGNGYVRSEGVVSLLIQKKSAAKRVYAKILGIQDSCDGYKEQGITFPSGQAQHQLLRSVYSRSGVDPSSVTYIEAHGTGTAAGDPQEVNTITEMFCKDRQTPLMIGSIKSNIGHTEGTAGLAGITKVLLSSEHKQLPANLHFHKANPNIPALHDGRIRVVDKNTPWAGGKAGVSSYGFGGANVHAILDTMCAKTQPQEDPTPRLVVLSGRSQEWVDNSLSLMTDNPTDLGLQGLMDAQANLPSKTHPIRGYAVLNTGKEDTETQECTTSSSPPLWFIFPGMGSQWPHMARDLVHNLPHFKRSFDLCHEALSTVGFDLHHLVFTASSDCYKDPQHAFIGICAVQICLVDLLHLYGIHPEGMIGHSVGELGCAYADGTLSREQTILAAYHRGRVLKQAQLQEGAMASVGLMWIQAHEFESKGVVAACHNAEKNVTISGPKENVEQVVNTLKEQGVFAKMVDSAGIAFHSYMLKPCADNLQKAFEKLIPSPKKRSAKWISSSVSTEQQERNSGALSSAEYHVNNFLSPVLFYGALQKIPKDAVCLEIGPHGLLRSLIKMVVGPDVKTLSLMKRLNEEANVLFCLQNIGKLYLHGFPLTAASLHPTVQYPVAHGTPMIGPCVKWDHSTELKVPQPSTNTDMGSSHEIIVDEHSYLLDHHINGQTLFPASGHILLAWQAFARRQNADILDTPVTITDLRILKGCIVSDEDKIQFSIELSSTGHFVISEDKIMLAEGNIEAIKVKQVLSESLQKPSEDCVFLKKEDIYQEFRVRGYDYGPQFQSLAQCHYQDKTGLVEWTGNWITFLDSMLQLYIICKPKRNVMLPVGVDTIHIDPAFSAKQDMYTGRMFQRGMTLAGVKMHGVRMTAVPLKNTHPEPLCQPYMFIPYNAEAAGLRKLSINNNRPKDVPQKRLRRMSSLIAPVSPIIGSSVGLPSETNLKHCLDIAMENSMKSQINILIAGSSEILVSVMELLRTILDIVFHRQFQLYISCADSQMEQMKKFTTSDRIIPHSGNGSMLKVVETADIFIMVDKSLTPKLKHLPCPAFAITFTELEETADTTSSSNQELAQIALFQDVLSKCVLYRKVSKLSRDATVVQINAGSDYKWVEELIATVKKTAGNEDARIWLLCEGQLHGIVGLVNCLLQETAGKLIRVIFNMDSTPLSKVLNSNGEVYNMIKQKDLVYNVLQGGKWGSFRHGMRLLMYDTKQVTEAYADVLYPGDLSSIVWRQLPTMSHQDEFICIDTHCASLNFRDIMLASGRLSTQAVPGCTDLTIGLEFSGTDSSGARKMGICNGGGLASQVFAYPYLTWDIPADWSNEEATTVPMAYATAYYALRVRARLTKRCTVLIHSATSSVGLACIRVAREVGCKVFATAGTETKRKYLVEELDFDPEYVSESRSLAFVKDVLKVTKGQGVDVVVNSLSGEKLIATIDIVAKDGQFLEIGKFDLSQNSQLGMGIFLRNISFHGIVLENLMLAPSDTWDEVHKLVHDGIQNGVVQPLTTHCFGRYHLEEAFRFVAEGEHIGKAVIQMKSPMYSDANFQAIPRTFFTPEKVYIITGGLGGLGLEMAYWMVERNARKIVLTSRQGVTKGYQRWMIYRMEQRGAVVKVMSHDVSHYDQAEALINESLELGPVGGIFHLAAVLDDNILELQSPDKFHRVCQVKTEGTLHLDKLSRDKLDTCLDWFVVFSSAAAGYGNAGQGNYAFANSFMERVMEKRTSDGLAGVSKAIQWGFMGDVGIVQRDLGGNSHFHMGLITQRSQSFLRTLDQFLCLPDIVLSSVVAAELSNSSHEGAEDAAVKILLDVCKIIGLKNTDDLQSGVPLLDYGLDSLMSTEIHHVLGKKYNIKVTLGEVQNLTLESIQQLGIN